MRFFIPGLLVLTLSLYGCSSATEEGSPDSPPPSHDLWEVAGLLRDHTAEYRKGPAKLADTIKNQPLYTRGYQTVKSGAIEVVWGVPMPAEGGSPNIIAYEKQAETEGGYVLLQDGNVKKMTAEEFKSTPKAK